MKKLILILLAFLAIFTYIRAFEQGDVGQVVLEAPEGITNEARFSIENEFSVDIPLEIGR